tara:strand:+ start:23864 stop:24766 length:903 start_codon:yes stop_codon:yes gene_type:complete
MRVDVEKRHIDSYEKLAKEANKAIKKANLKPQKARYRKVLLSTNISVESKKKRLAKILYELIIATFSDKKNSIKRLKENTSIIRQIIHKIKAINNYLEESFLRDLGITKKSLIVKAVKFKKPEKYLEKQGRVLSKDYINKIEHTVYELIQKVIFFDKKLLKKYSKKKIRIVKTEKLGIKDLEKTLKIESELLDALEAKIPPSKKVKAKLFKKELFNRWVPMVFALLSSFEAEHQKETLVFSNIKKNEKLRNKIEDKIKHVINEKEKLLKIKEKRALEMKNLKVSDDYRQTFHEYVSAASL